MGRGLRKGPEAGGISASPPEPSKSSSKLLKGEVAMGVVDVVGDAVLEATDEDEDG